MVILSNKTENNLGPYNGLTIPASQSVNVTGAMAPYISDGSLLSDVLAGNVSVNFSGTEVFQAAAASLLMQLGQILNTDSDGASLSRVKEAPSGWTYQQRGFEFQTSTLGSIVNNDYHNNALSDATLYLYDAQGNLITDQPTATTSCVKTVIDLVPPYDLYIIAGDAVCLTPPSDDAFLNVVIAPDYPAPVGSKVVIQNINMKYVATGDKVSANGRAGKGLLYNNPVPNSNKMRFIVYHSAGEVLSFGIQLETYRQ